MNRTKIISIATILALGLANLASAQDRRDDHGGPGGPGGPPHGPMQHHGGPAPRPAMDRSGPGAGPDHNWHRGDRLPPEYRNNSYVVDNWREHNLSAPPRGYHWVQAGGDYVLAAVATGVIASLLLNH